MDEAHGVDRMKNWKLAIAYCKFWIQRTYSYISCFSGLATAYLVWGRLSDKGKIPPKLEKYFPLFCLGIIILLVIVGYIEDKLGLAEAEYKIATKRMGLKEAKKDEGN
jgi:hypothetical protein